MATIPAFAENLMPKVRMANKGTYKHGWPAGAVVHFTAGRGTAPNVIAGGVKDGYTYWCIDKEGKLWCAHYAENWGFHAGKSGLKKKLLGGVSDDLIGIEIINAGKVTPMKDGSFKTWFGTYLTKEQVRFTAGTANQQKGWYEKYTPAQEATLIKTLLWLKEIKPTVFDLDLVLGHDEVAGPLGIGYFRKNDPGAALSMTMPEFREFLKGKWVAEKAA